ncbi:recombinase family protein [Streptomyces sp. PA5.6]|uniref:recombinase family protein n=1 Tax=Streptomyces sp. PA5.6 TaxID=3035651 RepID=UPI003904A105
MGKTLTTSVRVLDGALHLRAVDYLRVSTEEQTKGYGVQYSGKKTKRHIEDKGWTHVDTYIDDGIPGSLEAHQRPELRRLMADARSEPRPFDIVVVNEGRAIGRTGKAFWKWVWDLEEIGVYVGVVKDDYDNTTVHGRKMMRRDADYAETEYETIRDRTQNGIQEKAEDGLYPGGIVPYGWTIKNGAYVLDECDCTEKCHKVHETLVMRKARKLYIKLRAWVEVAEKLNAIGWFTRSGKPWSAKNIASRVMGGNAMTNKLVYRGKSAQLDAQGNPVYGKRTVIKLPKLFSKKEIRELKAIAESAKNGPRTTLGRPYFLTGRMTSPCGGSYQGKTSRPGVHAYVCKRAKALYPGVENDTCDCVRLDAGPVEDHVWAAVCTVLSDADRMKAMAADWIALNQTTTLNFAARIADLDQQLSEQDDAIDLATNMAAKSAARRGLRGKEAEEAIERTVHPLLAEFEALQKQRHDLEAWQRDAEKVKQRAKDLENLAQSTKGRLDTMPPEERRKILNTIKASARVLKTPGKRSGGVECAILAWFHENKREVPVLTDEGWELVKPIIARRANQQTNRTALEAALYKAVHGLRWRDMPERFGNPNSLQTKAFRWLAGGHWEQVMEALRDAPTQPAFARDPIQIEVSVRPGGLEFKVGTSELVPSPPDCPHRTPCARRSPAGPRRARRPGRARRTP